MAHDPEKPIATLTHYEVVQIAPKVSRATAVLSLNRALNGFYGAALVCEGPTTEIEKLMKARACWKIRQEAVIDYLPSEIVL
jgi:hypothetical protein